MLGAMLIGVNALNAGQLLSESTETGFIQNDRGVNTDDVVTNLLRDMDLAESRRQLAHEIVLGDEVNDGSVPQSIDAAAEGQFTESRRQLGTQEPDAGGCKKRGGIVDGDCPGIWQGGVCKCVPDHEGAPAEASAEAPAEAAAQPPSQVKGLLMQLNLDSEGNGVNKLTTAIESKFIKDYPTIEFVELGALEEGGKEFVVENELTEKQREIIVEHFQSQAGAGK